MTVYYHLIPTDAASIRKEVMRMAKNYRSAVSGKYVTKAYADKNPRITVGENNKPKGVPKGKGKKGK